MLTCLSKTPSERLYTILMALPHLNFYIGPIGVCCEGYGNQTVHVILYKTPTRSVTRLGWHSNIYFPSEGDRLPWYPSLGRLVLDMLRNWLG